MRDELRDRAIQIAKENRETFSFSLLKKELYIGIITCNILVDELENLGVIKQHNKHSEGKYRIEVLI